MSSFCLVIEDDSGVYTVPNLRSVSDFRRAVESVLSHRPIDDAILDDIAGNVRGVSVFEPTARGFYHLSVEGLDR